MIESKTAESRGFGSDRYKSVSFLTKEERDAVKKGEIVWYREDSSRVHGAGGYTDIRIVITKTVYANIFNTKTEKWERIPKRIYWKRRLPTQEEINQIELEKR